MIKSIATRQGLRPLLFIVASVLLLLPDISCAAEKLPEMKTTVDCYDFVWPEDSIWASVTKQQEIRANQISRELAEEAAKQWSVFLQQGGWQVKKVLYEDLKHQPGKVNVRIRFKGQDHLKPYRVFNSEKFGFSPKKQHVQAAVEAARKAGLNVVATTPNALYLRISASEVSSHKIPRKFKEGFQKKEQVIAAMKSACQHLGEQGAHVIQCGLYHQKQGHEAAINPNLNEPVSDHQAGWAYVIAVYFGEK